MKKITFLFILLPFLGFGQLQIGDDIYGNFFNDESGTSISMSSDGSIIAIGAPFNDDNGTNSGHVRVYENQGGTWTQIGDDINGEFEGDRLGTSVSLSSDGNILAIGAPFNDGGFFFDVINSGHVRVYENQGGNWIQIGDVIDGESIADRSGVSVSLSSDGTILAIGAPFNVGNSTDGGKAGHTRVYENQSGDWIQIGDDINGTGLSAKAGHSVSLSSDGTILAIGSPNKYIGDGSVSIYEFQSGNWTLLGSEITDIFEGESGHSVSLSSDGTILVVGQPTTGNGATLNHGRVRVYNYTLNNWTQIGNDIIGEEMYDRFGESVSISSDGSIIVVGVEGNDLNGTNSGLVRMYKNLDDVWTEITNGITGDAEGDNLGKSVSISSDGTILAVGAKNNDNSNGTNSGQVRIFSIASDIIILEVVDDITGNANGINITADQLNNITGVSGAIEGVNYTTALDNGTFLDENNPRPSEIQFIIDQVNATLNVNEFGLFNFKLYPNPAKTQFTIELDQSVQLEYVSIYNLLGQVVLTSKEYIVNTSKLASGSYIAEITTNQGKAIKKLIID